MNKNLLLVILMAMAASPAGATIWYVNASQSSGTKDGHTWATAFSNFQSGVNAAASGDSVWVAAGTYQPANGVSFTMAKGVKIFGGFAGTESNFSFRNWETNICLLLGNGTNVILNYNNGLDSTALLDGFLVEGAGLPFYKYTGTVGASGIYNYHSSPAINHVTFTNNSNLVSNLPLRLQFGGGMYNNDASPVITNSTFNADSAYNGGGIYNDSNSIPTINNCTFLYNFSYNNGGGIANEHGSNAVITNTTFTQNTGSNFGAGIYNNSSSPLITNDSLGGNLASNGAGIFNDSSSVSDIENCVFTKDSVSNTGGGICNNNSSPNITHCNFTGNTYAYGGPAIENDAYSSPNISFCVFTGDTASGSGGGAIENYNYSSPAISNDVFTGDVAEYDGGAIENIMNCNPTITDCKFVSDTAGVGGAIDCQDSSNCTIKNSFFSKNVSTDLGARGGSGGAISILSSAPTIIDCVFDGNMAIGTLQYEGGGAIVNSGGAPSLINCLFTGNSSTNHGGAIINLASTNTLIANCSFVNDSAVLGGAIYNDEAGSATIVNSVFWNDTASALSDIGSSFNSTASVSYSFTQTPFPGTGNIVGTGSPFVNINNPAGPDGIFLTADDGLYLTSNAPAAGTGSVAAIPTGITTDITGASRTTNNLVDMGAYENPGTTPVTLLSFTVRSQADNTARLLWSTSQEFNNSYFGIERSSNTEKWATIGSVPGAGNSSTQRNYSFTDTHPAIGSNFYRLRQVDLNGHLSYSYVVSLNFNQPSNLFAMAFPNPVHDRLTIYADQNWINAAIEVIDMNGQKLLETTNISGTSKNLSLRFLAAGTYLLRIIDRGNISLLKIVKQ